MIKNKHHRSNQPLWCFYRLPASAGEFSYCFTLKARA